MTQSFWKPRPREPWSDWRMHSMLAPILVSAVGFFVTGIFAFAFSDIDVIPAQAQSWMVIVGSALIIFGAELNTPFTTVEVFRKILRGEANGWDTSALAVSLVGTVVNLLVTFASRLSLETAWKAFVLNWGPLLSGFAVACDYYGAMVELGFLFGSFELRMETWLEERRAYYAEHAQAEPEHAGDGATPAIVATSDAWPVATLDQWRAIARSMNGSRAQCDADAVTAELARRQLAPPSSSTVRRWAKLTADGEL